MHRFDGELRLCGIAYTCAADCAIEKSAAAVPGGQSFASRCWRSTAAVADETPSGNLAIRRLIRLSRRPVRSHAATKSVGMPMDLHYSGMRVTLGSRILCASVRLN